MKFALISNVLPPSESAHAAIIERLLRDANPESYCLLSSKDYARESGPDYTGRLAGRYYHLTPPFEFTRGYHYGLRSLRERMVNPLLGIAQRVRQIAKILRAERCDCVVVCTGGREIFDFPAGYIAARMTGARFYAYLLDQYSHMVSYVLGDTFLRRFERTVMRGAAGVIVPNEFMREEVERRYGVRAIIVRNACDVAAYDEGAATEREAGDTGTSIVYTGGVGALHADAFGNLLKALVKLGREGLKLHLYTPQSREELGRFGVDGPSVVLHGHEPVSAMPSVQGGADVLFLPLAFRSPYPDIVRTAAPGKIGEYLASRRPILVHAPKDSFLSWYFRTHECGLVVDEDDPAALARSLERIIDDAPLRERIAARARERAEVDFDLPKARARFMHVIEGGHAPDEDRSMKVSESAGA